MEYFYESMVNFRKNQRQLQQLMDVVSKSMKKESNSKREVDDYVKVFDFDGDEDDYVDWERKIERYFTRNELSAKERYKFAKQKLVADAAKWFQRLQKERVWNGKKKVDTWNHMKEKLQRKYAPLSYRQQLMWERQQAMEQERRRHEEECRRQVNQQWERLFSMVRKERDREKEEQATRVTVVGNVVEQQHVQAEALNSIVVQSPTPIRGEILDSIKPVRHDIELDTSKLDGKKHNLVVPSQKAKKFAEVVMGAKRKNSNSNARSFVKGDLVYVRIAKGRFTRKLKHHKEKLVAANKTGPFRVLARKTKDTYLVELSSKPPIFAEFHRVHMKPCLNSRTNSLKGGGNEPSSRPIKQGVHNWRDRGFDSPNIASLVRAFGDLEAKSARLLAKMGRFVRGNYGVINLENNK